MTILKRRKKSCVFSLHIRRFHQFPKSTWLCNMEFQTKGRTPWMFGLQTFPRIALKFVYKNPQPSVAFTTSFRWYVKCNHDKVFNGFKFSIVLSLCRTGWRSNITRQLGRQRSPHWWSFPKTKNHLHETVTFCVRYDQTKVIVRVLSQWLL